MTREQLSQAILREEEFQRRQTSEAADRMREISAKIYVDPDVSPEDLMSCIERIGWACRAACLSAIREQRAARKLELMEESNASDA